MPSKRKRIVEEDGDDEGIGPSAFSPHTGIEDALEDDVPVAEAAPTAPAQRRKLRRAHEAVGDGARPGRWDGRAPRAATVATPNTGVKERLLANQKRFRSELKGLRPKHIGDYLIGGDEDGEADGDGDMFYSCDDSSDGDSSSDDDDSSDAQPAGRVEATGAEKRQGNDDDDDDDLDGFIVRDAKEEAGFSRPVETVQDIRLRTALQAIRHKLQRNGEDPDRPLAEDFPNYVAAMVFRYLGLKMPEWLAEAGWRAKLRMERIMLGSTKDVIQGNLGWVNAERNGIMAAMRRLPLLSTDWTFSQEDLTSGSYNEVDEEARDGEITCQVCGRTTGPVRALWFKGMPYDKDKLGRPQWAEQEEVKFVTGSDCVQRVMVGHLLEHWEWALVAKLTAEVKRVYHKLSADTEDRAYQAALESLGNVSFISSLFGITNRAVGLGRRVHTSPVKNGRRGRYSSSMQGKTVGNEVLDICAKMNPRQRTLDWWYDRL